MGKGTKNKAKRTANKVQRTITKRKHKIRTKPIFYRPKTKTQSRNPKRLRTIATFIQRGDTENPNNVIISPLSSDKNMQKMENENTLAFLVALGANKCQIRDAFVTLYGAKVRKVNTLIRPDGKKKAYIRLAGASEALRVATKIGVI